MPTSSSPPPTKLDPAKTARRRNLRTRRLETWEAASADGQWAYIRAEAPGTPWDVKHLPTGVVLPGYPTLVSARRDTASGRAAGDVLRALPDETPILALLTASPVLLAVLETVPAPMVVFSTLLDAAVVLNRVRGKHLVLAYGDDAAAVCAARRVRVAVNPSIKTSIVLCLGHQALDWDAAAILGVDSVLEVPLALPYLRGLLGVQAGAGDAPR